jgi:hypothetical protein
MMVNNVPAAFVRGYAAAVAAMERRQTDSVRLLREAGIDIDALEAAGVDEFDMEQLRPLFGIELEKL